MYTINPMKRINHLLSAALSAVFLAVSFVSCRQSAPELERKLVPVMEAALDEYIQVASDSAVPLAAIVVLQNGKVIGERYVNGWQKDSSHHMWSTSKSYTSLAVGFAVKEGLLSLDDKVCTFFPEYYDKYIDGSDQGKYIAAGTVRDYLVMATGQEEDPTWRGILFMRERHPEIVMDENLRGLGAYYDAAGRNLVEDIFLVPFTKEPGTRNCYNSFATYVLSAILQKVTGEKTVDYLEERLWKPLGISKPEWLEVNGVSAGGWGLMLSAEDMAKTGQMLLDNGCYAGRQVVPADYLAEAVSAYFTWDPPTFASPAEKPSYHQGYGYQFWINGDGYNTAGAQGQFIIVLPEYEAVIVGIADIKDDDHKEMALMWKYIVPILKQEL